MQNHIHHIQLTQYINYLNKRLKQSVHQIHHKLQLAVDLQRNGQIKRAKVMYQINIQQQEHDGVDHLVHQLLHIYFQLMLLNILLVQVHNKLLS